MNITPDTNIKLLKCPLELDNKNQITFSNATAQYNYFNSLPKLETDGSYYQRKDSSIYYPDNFDDLLEYNYVMYQNNNYSNKWFYAFIENIEYVSDNCTRLEITTDVFQTWQFDLTYKPSFVVREHTNDDTVGSNVLPENLEIGEYICNKFDKLLHSNDSPLNTNTDLSIVVACTLDTTGSGFTNVGTQVDGIFQGVNYFCFHNRGAGQVTDTHGIEALNTFLRDYATQGKLDYIQSIFMIPSFACQGADDRDDHKYVGSNLVYNTYVNSSSHAPANKNMDFSLTTIDGYTPKNNKLKTYPYSYLLVSNCSGTDVPYRFEDFYTITNNVKTIVTPSFRVQSCMAPSGSIRMLPLNYKGQETNAIEGMNLGKFPMCSWVGDSYTNWLTQNGVNIGLNIAGSLLSTGTSAATGNPIGVASGILGVANTIGQIHKEAIAPLQSRGNINCGDVVTASGQNDFRFQVMTIKAQYAKIVDDYFTTYGYATNDLKVPNITGRSNWNYVETRNANIIADIPQQDLNTIKEMFNTGITLWHTTTYFLDYSQTNSIVS